jgi:nucleoid DNA-binding protein
MTQDDISRSVAATLDLDPEMTRSIIGHFIGQTHTLISIGYEVKIESLGTFRTKTTLRKLWNFQRRESRMVELKRIVFKVADNLKPRVAGNGRRDRKD